MYNCGNGKGRENYRHFEFYDIHHSPIIPTIDIPNGFGSDRKDKEDAYLEYLSFAKAKHCAPKALFMQVPIPTEL